MCNDGRAERGRREAHSGVMTARWSCAAAYPGSPLPLGALVTFRTPTPERPAPAAVIIFVLSVDVAIKKACDLLQPRVVTEWCVCVRDGRIIGALGGPPCETYAAARWINIDEAGVEPQYATGARPLRTWEDP